jgi:talin
MLIHKYFCSVFSLKEFLPLAFMKVKNVEKKIFAEHKTLVGVTEIDAKYKYVKLARGLPTFGVHFFLVKVRIPFISSFFLNLGVS